MKCLFINPLINGGGSGTLLGGTTSHVQLFTFSEWCDLDLLAGIDRIKPRLISLFPSQVCRNGLTYLVNSNHLNQLSESNSNVENGSNFLRSNLMKKSKCFTFASLLDKLLLQPFISL